MNYAIKLKDAWDESKPTRVVEIELSESERSELDTWTSSKMYEHVRMNVVGKCNTDPGDRERYFCPPIRVGKLTLSLQVGYYLWRERHVNGDHKQLITAEEFGVAIPDEYTSIDVMILYDGKQLACGQCSMVWLAARLAEMLAYGDTEIYTTL